MNIILKFLNNWSVPIIILSLPLYLVRFDVFGIPSTLLEVLFLGFFIIWFLENYQGIKNRIKTKISSQKSNSDEQKKQPRNYPFSIFILLFVLSSFIGLSITGFSNQALGIYKSYFIEPVLFFVMAFNYLQKEEKRKIAINSLFVGAFFLSVYAIVQKFFGIYWEGGAGELRVSSVFPYPNALGLFLGPVSVFAYFYFLNLIKNGCPVFLKHKIYNFFVGLTFVLSLLSVYFARSEAAFIAIVFAIVISSFFVSKKLALAFSIIVLLGAGVIFTNQNYKGVFLEKAQLNDFSGEVRKQQWRETGEMLKNEKRYLLGCGLSVYQECIGPYHQEGIFFNKDKDPDFRRKIVIFDDQYRAERWRPVEIYMYPHNIFLNFWVELGILGLIAFVGVVIQYFYFGITMLRNSAANRNGGSRIIIIGLLAVMIEILVHGLVDVPYFKNDLSFMFWFFVAMIGVYWIDNKIAKDNK